MHLVKISFFTSQTLNHVNFFLLIWLAVLSKDIMKPQFRLTTIWNWLAPLVNGNETKIY